MAASVCLFKDSGDGQRSAVPKCGLYTSSGLGGGAGFEGCGEGVGGRSAVGVGGGGGALGGDAQDAGGLQGFGEVEAEGHLDALIEAKQSVEGGFDVYRGAFLGIGEIDEGAAPPRGLLGNMGEDFGGDFLP